MFESQPGQREKCYLLQFVGITLHMVLADCQSVKLLWFSRRNVWDWGFKLNIMWCYQMCHVFPVFAHHTNNVRYHWTTGPKLRVRVSWECFHCHLLWPGKVCKECELCGKCIGLLFQEQVKQSAITCGLVSRSYYKKQTSDLKVYWNHSSATATSINTTQTTQIQATHQLQHNYSAI